MIVLRSVRAGLPEAGETRRSASSEGGQTAEGRRRETARAALDGENGVVRSEEATRITLTVSGILGSRPIGSKFSLFGLEL